jgi:hypothetical protein
MRTRVVLHTLTGELALWTAASSSDEIPEPPAILELLLSEASLVISMPPAAADGTVSTTTVVGTERWEMCTWRQARTNPDPDLCSARFHPAQEAKEVVGMKECVAKPGVYHKLHNWAPLTTRFGLPLPNGEYMRLNCVN